MKLYEYISMHELDKAIMLGYVEKHNHPTLPLLQYTFTRRAYYEGHWNNVTRKCRGLIVDDNTGNIISRPFEKFFNYCEELANQDMDSIPCTIPYTVADKLNGSLGILWQYPGTVGTVKGIATKGSFASEQAKWATSFYNQYYYSAQWPDGWTVLFEIINEDIEIHATRYGFKDLVLIGMINNETGEELSIDRLEYHADINGMKVASSVLHAPLHVLQEHDRHNKEGYVITWPLPGRTPVKVKIKHPTFLQLKSVLDDASDKNIIGAIAENDKELLDKFLTAKHPEVVARVKKLKEEMYYRFAQIMYTAKQWVLEGLTHYSTRKEFAEYLLKYGNNYPSVCFAMIDQQDWKAVIWKIVKKEFLEREKEK